MFLFFLIFISELVKTMCTEDTFCPYLKAVIQDISYKHWILPCNCHFIALFNIWVYYYFETLIEKHFLKEKSYFNYLMFFSYLLFKVNHFLHLLVKMFDKMIDGISCVFSQFLIDLFLHYNPFTIVIEHFSYSSIHQATIAQGLRSSRLI